jgi:uncharacterized membrane protein YccC
MEKVWILVAGVGIAVAVICLFLGYTDAAFVAAVLGCVAWFLNYRSRIKSTASPAEEID